jgi:AraC-like DNA-binding protein
MIWFEFDHADYHSLLQDLAEKLGTRVENEVLYLPAAFGNGYLRAIRLPNGLSALVTENTVTTDIVLKRVRREPSFYILSFDDVRITQSFQHVVAGEREHVRPPIYAGASLGSTRYDNTLIASKNFTFNGIRILFPPSWLARYFRISKEDDLMAEYLSYKTRKLTLEPLDVEYRKLMDDVFRADLDSPVYFATVENRIMLMMERFFSRLEENVKEAKYKRLDKNDIYKMMQVESEIADVRSVQLPTAVELARKYGFSETKLKRLFREIYGYPLYEYFQRCRLERARDMLVSGGHSVKEAGLAVGYKSLSNFSKAFRHVYGVLPGEVMK